MCSCSEIGPSQASPAWSLLLASFVMQCLRWPSEHWGASVSCFLLQGTTHQGQQMCLMSVCFPPAEDTDLGHTLSCSTVLLPLCGQVSISCRQFFANLNSKPKPCWAVEFFGCLASDIVTEESCEGGKRSKKCLLWLGGRKPNSRALCTI